jgi:hypothetical protein
VLKEYEVKHGYHFKRYHNQKKKVTSTYSGVGCQWRIYVSPVPGSNTLWLRLLRISILVLNLSLLKLSILLRLQIRY